MALIDSKSSQRIIPPHEPESWFEMRPLRTGDVPALTADGDMIVVSIGVLADLLTAWSYDAELNAENVALLDLDTFEWLTDEVYRISGLRDKHEKKGSGKGLSPSQPPKAEASTPASSPTSKSAGG